VKLPNVASEQRQIQTLCKLAVQRLSPLHVESRNTLTTIYCPVQQHDAFPAVKSATGGLERQTDLDRIISDLPNGFATFDRQWRYTYVNNRLLEIFKLSRTEVLGKKAWEVFPHQVGIEFFDLLNRAMTERTEAQFEFYYELAECWAEHRIYPTADGLAILMADVSERKQAELLLLEQQQLLELTASGAPMAECLAAVCTSVSKLSHDVRACILLADSQRETFIDCIAPTFPPSWVQGIWGAPIDELTIGTCAAAVYHGRSVTCADIASDDSWSQPWRDICLAHGVLACHSAPILNADDVPLGSLMLCFDTAREPTAWECQLADFGTHIASIVFERDRSSLALRESAAEYQNLFESIDEGFCIIESIFDAQDRPVDYLFWQVNPAFYRLTGLSVEVVGKTAHELVPDIEQFWVETYGKVALTGESVRFENESVPMNRWFDIYASRVGDTTSRRVAVVFNNITERKQAEKISQRAAKFDAVRITLADAVRPLADPVEIQVTASRILGEHLNANRVAYFEVRSDNYVIERDYINGVTPLSGNYPINSFGSTLLTAYRSGRTVSESNIAADLSLSPAERAAFAAIEIGAHIAIPLIKGGEFVAGLAVHASAPRVWTPDEIALVEEVAERTWATLERAHAEAAVAANLRNTQLLRDLSARLVTEDDTQTLYREILTTAIDLTDADGGTVRTIDDRSQDFILIGSQGFDRQMNEDFYRVDSSSHTPCGLALRHGKRIFVDFDVSEAEDPDGTMQRHFEAGYRSAQSTLLFSRTGKPLGMVTTHWRSHHRPIDRELQSLDLLARQAADLIEQQQITTALRESEQQMAIELADTQQLQHISSQLIREDNIHAIYQQILDAASALMGADMGSVQMLDTDTNELRLLAWQGFAPASAEFWSWVRVDSGSPCSAALAEGKRSIVPDVETCDFIAGTEDLDHFRLSGIRAVQSTPLISRHGRLVGMISTHWREPHQPSVRRMGLLDVLARQVADLLDRKQIELTLRESQERLSLVQLAAKIGGWDWDVTTGEIYWSPEYYILYGIDPAVSPSYDNWLASILAADRDTAERAMQEALQQQQTYFNYEFRIAHPVQGLRWIGARGQIFYDLAGQPQRVTGIAIDVTDRKQVEIALAERNQELDSFVHVVSHDLKAPLRAISNLSAWIEEDFGIQLPANTQQQLAQLRGRVQRMEAMITGLLEYARIGRTDDQLDLVSVAELLAEILESIAPPSTFEIFIAPDLPTFYAKRLLLSQVFTNLISNAFKHHDRSDGFIRISCQEQGDFYEFTVVDDGPGIAQEQCDRVFVIFQAANPQKNPDSTGIGLSIVKKIVETAGGQIRLESDLGAGTTFHFTWPKSGENFPSD
jgi:PAS domain S-box-containing protein